MEAAQHAIATAYRNLKALQTPSGLFRASSSSVSTGYDLAWWRDNLYEAIGLEAYGDFDGVRKVYDALFTILDKHRYKIEWAIEHRPHLEYQYIHARYSPDTLEEIPEPWGNAQNDMVGLFLFKTSELADHLNISGRHLDLIQMLVKYLASIHYWEDHDNGMWEEYREVHTSSVGICLAGLQAVHNKFFTVDQSLMDHGRQTLDQLSPRESYSKRCDLAQLALIWPCNIVSETQRAQIIERIEMELLRSRGVIRYAGDLYYNEGGEAEWTFGASWLALAHQNTPKFDLYLRMALGLRNERGETPELYLANGTPNENTPLGWSEALLLAALTAGERNRCDVGLFHKTL